MDIVPIHRYRFRLIDTYCFNFMLGKLPGGLFIVKIRSGTKPTEFSLSISTNDNAGLPMIWKT